MVHTHASFIILVVLFMCYSRDVKSLVHYSIFRSEKLCSGCSYTWRGLALDQQVKESSVEMRRNC